MKYIYIIKIQHKLLLFCPLLCASVRVSCCQGLDSFNEPTPATTSAATTMGTMHKQQQYRSNNSNSNNNNTNNNHGPHVQKLFSIETKDKQEASVAQKERR